MSERILEKNLDSRKCLRKQIKSILRMEMDDELQCDLLSIFHNITTNCSNDIGVARDECKVICIISIMKGIEDGV